MSLTDFDFTGGDFGFGAGGGLGGKAVANQSQQGGLGFGDTSSAFNLGGTDGMGGNIFGKGGMASMALGGLQALGSFWQSFQANKMAKKQFKFTKKAYETDLKNTTKVYNTALEDRIAARYVTENRAPGEADAYLKEHRIA